MAASASSFLLFLTEGGAGLLAAAGTEGAVPEIDIRLVNVELVGAACPAETLGQP
ncbi:hypothetical protein [Actinacidiphila sp. bgisy167]|uniref:hypothetical protein n=1 Tax=Actinacidiphila sp. bgisy167 TaxID=3413797 RepID=UPI003D7617D7